MARIIDQLMYIIGVLLLSLSLMASTSDEREDTLNVASYNSMGFSDNRVEIIKELLAYNNIVLILEWTTSLDTSGR